MAISQTTLDMSNKLEHHFTHGCLGDYIETELIPERLTQIRGKVPGPRSSDVVRDVNRVDASLKPSHGVPSVASGPRGPLFRQLNSYSANRTCPQRTSGSSQGGTHRAQPASRRAKNRPFSNAKQPNKRRRKANSDDSDDNDDKSTPSRGKKPADSKSDSRKFACPILTAFPGSGLQCHDRGGFDDTSRVKYVKLQPFHDKYQCRRCGMIYEEDDQYEDHVRTNACTPPPRGVYILVVNRKQVKELRSREGLQGMSEEDRWDKIYRTIFRVDCLHSPYVEEHTEHRVQEAPQQLQEIPQQQQEVPQQPQGTSLQMPLELAQQLQSALQEFQEMRQGQRQIVDQLARHEAYFQTQRALQPPPNIRQEPQQFDGTSYAGSQFYMPGNTGAGYYYDDNDTIDPAILQLMQSNANPQGPGV
ncbi:hypothetical protein Daesc_002069 [Daldinia eschscholtzii]|uniref:C2H2-type domain-containing protein n=1 Tax=Daldinia eschscholtzii TaxID=292717 RepID=A0AAX6MW02_9PEZI